MKIVAMIWDKGPYSVNWSAGEWFNFLPFNCVANFVVLLISFTAVVTLDV